MNNNHDIWLTFVISLVLAIAMLWPIQEISLAPIGSDKIIHIAAFAALACPLAYTRRLKFQGTLLFACIFGGLIEMSQHFFGRHPDVLDWLCNNLGAVAGFTVALLSRKFLKE
jgi:VanZ family protein